MLLDTLNVSSTFSNFIGSIQTCILNQGFLVTIPNSIRKEVNLKPSQEVLLYIKSGNIVIQEKRLESTENMTLVSSKGSIYIPKEIRTTLNIQKRDTFQIFYNKETKTIILKPDNSITK
ncbi:MAG: hypothetical protein LPK26_09085 [Bacillaceae bacterium]|nr:hypothetical protein [Bacillaceae bacterium]